MPGYGPSTSATNPSNATIPFLVRRTLEILPTATVWLIITAPVWGAIIAPAGLGFWLLHRAEARDWLADAKQQPGFDDLHHLVIVPTCGEGEEILADTLRYLTQQDMPLERVSVVLACEERDTMAPVRAQRLAARFSSLFEQFLITFHPDLPGEVKGKSSNLTWAAQRVQAELVETGKLDTRNLLVTICDADSRLHRSYLSA